VDASKPSPLLRLRVVFAVSRYRCCGINSASHLCVFLIVHLLAERHLQHQKVLKQFDQESQLEYNQHHISMTAEEKVGVWLACISVDIPLCPEMQLVYFYRKSCVSPLLDGGLKHFTVRPLIPPQFHYTSGISQSPDNTELFNGCSMELYPWMYRMYSEFPC